MASSSRDPSRHRKDEVLRFLEGETFPHSEDFLPPVPDCHPFLWCNSYFELCPQSLDAVEVWNLRRPIASLLPQLPTPQQPLLMRASWQGAFPHCRIAPPSGLRVSLVERKASCKRSNYLLSTWTREVAPLIEIRPPDHNGWRVFHGWDSPALPPFYQTFLAVGGKLEPALIRGENPTPVPFPVLEAPDEPNPFR